MRTLRKRCGIRPSALLYAAAPNQWPAFGEPRSSGLEAGSCHASCLAPPAVPPQFFVEGVQRRASTASFLVEAQATSGTSPLTKDCCSRWWRFAHIFGSGDAGCVRVAVLTSDGRVIVSFTTDATIMILRPPKSKRRAAMEYGLLAYLALHCCDCFARCQPAPLIAGTRFSVRQFLNCFPPARWLFKRSRPSHS